LFPDLQIEASTQDLSAWAAPGGAHFRNDYPKRDDKTFLKHSAVGRGGVVRFEA
jgi:succinate dehydrogenase/fumarate reductase flavoprotein subunit